MLQKNAMFGVENTKSSSPTESVKDGKNEEEDIKGSKWTDGNLEIHRISVCNDLFFFLECQQAIS